MWIWGGTTQRTASAAKATATAFCDTASGSFERHRSNEPLLTPIPLIRAVDPPDAGVVAVAVSNEQALIFAARSDARAVSKKKVCRSRLIR
jgi:hypothetical protein